MKVGHDPVVFSLAHDGALNQLDHPLCHPGLSFIYCRPIGTKKISQTLQEFIFQNSVFLCGK
jgi:hypothetical protein